MTGRAELEAVLVPVAMSGGVTTYRDLAVALGLKPPGTVQKVATALEAMMGEHAAEGRPQLAAVVVSRSGEGLPAPGFFERLVELGLYDGPPEGPGAAAFHAAELARVREHWGPPEG